MTGIPRRGHRRRGAATVAAHGRRSHRRIDQRAIVMRTREDVSTFTLTFDNSTDKVDFEFWVSYQVQTPQLRETIKALSSDRQVWAKSNMPGPVATLFRTSAERPAASA